MKQAVWQSGQNGALVSHAAGFHLEVVPAKNAARYQVSRQGTVELPTVLLVSGHSDNMRLAMAKAEQVADRLQLPVGRPAGPPDAACAPR